MCTCTFFYQYTLYISIYFYVHVVLSVSVCVFLYVNECDGYPQTALFYLSVLVFDIFYDRFRSVVFIYCLHLIFPHG